MAGGSRAQPIGDDALAVVVRTESTDASEPVRDVGTVKDAEPIVRGKILQAQEAVERDPSSAPDLLKAVAAASCSCLHLVPGLEG